jgi:hypothetical protein
MQGFQLDPLFRLRSLNECQHLLRKNGAVAIETFAIDRHVAIAKQMGFNDSLEGELRMTCLTHQSIPASFCRNHHTAT